MAANPCPACGEPIAIDDLNLAQGVGLCRACGKLSTLSDIAAQPDVDPAAVRYPPAGCVYGEPFAGEGNVLTASLRSLRKAAGLLAFCLFWNGITSVFVLGGLGGLYKHFVGALPLWYPFQAARHHGKSDLSDSLVGSIVILLFVTPHVCIGIGMICALVMSLIGRIEVRINETAVRVRTGVGPLNWTRWFAPADVTRVAEEVETGRRGGRTEVVRVDCGQRKIRFGSMLTPPRRKWLVDALHLLLVAPAKAARQRTGLPMPPRD